MSTIPTSGLIVIDGTYAMAFANRVHRILNHCGIASIIIEPTHTADITFQRMMHSEQPIFLVIPPNWKQTDDAKNAADMVVRSSDGSLGNIIKGGNGVIDLRWHESRMHWRGVEDSGRLP